MLLMENTEMSALLADTDIRPALKTRLVAEHMNDAGTVLLEELGVCRGQVRIDLAVVNGLLHGFEIKSDRDSLRRLASQADLYSKVFDRTTLVVGKRHLDEALTIIPCWWGVWRVEPTWQGPRFKVVRRGSRNAGLDPRLLVELLWLDEAVTLLEQRGAARGIKGKPRRVVWDRVCEYLCTNEIATAVRDHLKARAAMLSLSSPSRCDGWCQDVATLPENQISLLHPQHPS